MTAPTVVYGGSFDPPHLSHQMTCLYLLEGLGAAEVWVIPAAVHPFGKLLSPFETRFAMCEMMAAPFQQHVRVLRTEQELGGQGRTFATLQYLQQQQPQRRFVLAIGADITQETARWHRWADIVAMVEIWVIGRSGYTSQETSATAPEPAHPLPAVELPAISSRTLRQWAQQGRSLHGWVPMSIARYIAAQRLYQ